MQEKMYLAQVLERGNHCAHSGAMPADLKSVREKAKLSQVALAAAINSGRSTIVKLEKGELPLTVEWAKRLAPALNVHPSDLAEAAPLPSESEFQAMIHTAALEVPPGAPTAEWIEIVAASLREQLRRYQVDRAFDESRD